MKVKLNKLKTVLFGSAKRKLVTSAVIAGLGVAGVSAEKAGKLEPVVDLALTVLPALI